MEKQLKPLSRIMHVITDFSNLAGAEQSLINLIGAGLSETALIVSLKSTSIADTGCLEGKGCSFVDLNIRGLNIVAAERGIDRAYRDFKPEAVVSWMYHANVASALFRLKRRAPEPLIWTVHHSLEDFRRESVSTKCAIVAGGLLSRVPDAIAYVSERARAQHRIAFGSKTPSPVISNAIPAPKAYEPRARQPGIVIGFAARYHPIKDFRTFIRTMKQVTEALPDARVVACGRDVHAQNEELAAMVRHEGLDPGRIELLGHVDDMGPFYDAIDLFLLTSRSEGFGMVLAEAMARGIPCVSTDVGAAREIIGSTGAIAGVGQPEELAGAILQFADMSTDTREALRRDAHERAQALFGPDAVRTAYLELIDSVPARTRTS